MLFRSENLKIIPVCDYAKKVLTQDETYRDVLADEVLLATDKEV